MQLTLQRRRFALDPLRVGLLVCALLINVVPVYQFIGSMIWFHTFHGDYKVFWGITKVPTGGIYDHHVFAYPPTSLLLLSLFGWLPFWSSLTLWSSAGIAAMICATKRIARPLAITLGFLTFAAVGVVLGGQTSFFVGALIIGGLSVSTTRWQGILLGLAAAIKPQSVLAAPIMLIADRNWKAIGWAVAAVVCAAALSILLFGLHVWARWFSELPKFHAYLVGHGIDRMDVGIYGLASAFGLPGWLFLFAAPLGIATSWLVSRSCAATLDRYAAFAASTVLMSPYTLYYDLAGLTFVSVALLLDRDRSPLIWLAAALIVSSVFAGIGIVLLAGVLCFEVLAKSGENTINATADWLRPASAEQTVA